MRKANGGNTALVVVVFKAFHGVKLCIAVSLFTEQHTLNTIILKVKFCNRQRSRAYSGLELEL